MTLKLLQGDLPSATSYGVCVSQLVRFTRSCNNVNDFHDRNIMITCKLHSGIPIPQTPSHVFQILQALRTSFDEI